MPRNRVSSFFERWSQSAPSSPPSENRSSFSPPSRGVLTKDAPFSPHPQESESSVHTISQTSKIDSPPIGYSDTPTGHRTRANTGNSVRSSRPSSMVQTYQPPLMEVANDTPPELQPIFTFLNSHSNKLYQEGYFLKLHDLDTKGRPSRDRTWQECFAQLVGTVLSLWDASDLDAAGDDGEVVPTFINLADASIKMIQSLPMNEGAGSQLQNVLSVSTAANNRYLLHFNSLNSLTQWTAGIRLAMYEYATLQEAYTGSLVAGKGKTLNNIRTILERNKFKHEDWARVRFGAGTPWRRCWFVISPPDEKEWDKAQKAAKKNKYGKPAILKGDVKFYETRKITKRTRPIATITNAYSVYAIYPQSKPLIDQSTLVKIEGKIMIHSIPESVTEGFVFVMPETHPAISGFEMLLRFLFPVWDAFALYGRPTRLIADVLDQRGLMFAMPRERRYGYLEILDVAGLIHTEGSSTWSERAWRASLKELTSKRMLASGDEPQRRVTSRASIPGARNSVLRFDESGRNTPAGVSPDRRAESALDGYPQGAMTGHRRTASEATNLSPYSNARNRPDQANYSTSAIDQRDMSPPRPPLHSAYASGESIEQTTGMYSETSTPDRDIIPPEVKAMGIRSPPPEPVDPPIHAHAPSEKPRTRPNQLPEVRRDHQNLDQETRLQMAEATGRLGQYAQQGPSSYGQSANGFANGQGQHTSSRVDNYQQNAHNRLSTIPASPFLEQDSPMERAGAVLPPPTIPEHRSSSPNMATAAARAALTVGSPPNRGTPSPAHTSNPIEQTYNMYKVNTNGSANSLQKVASSEGRPKLENRHSVQRKPVGSGQTHSATSPPANALWTPHRFSYEAPREQGYAQSPAEHPLPYQQDAPAYEFPPQQGQYPPAHNGQQMPYRPGPPQGQQGWR